MSIINALKPFPVILAVKNDQQLQSALNSPCAIIFVLYGNICTICRIVQEIKKTNKLAFIHVDLLEGASSKEIVIDFIKMVTQADGIISTKAPMLKKAKNQGFYTVHRLFLVDSFSYFNVVKQITYSGADCIEIMPGCIPNVINWIKDIVTVPIIAGGLVCNQKDAYDALNAGARCISSTNEDVWMLNQNEENRFKAQ